MMNAWWYFCLRSLRNLMGTNQLGNNNPVLNIVYTSQWGAFVKICLVYEWLKGITEISDGSTYMCTSHEDNFERLQAVVQAHSGEVLQG